MKSPRKGAPHERWHPVDDYTARDIRALQAVAQGNGNEDDQRHAINWIINKAAQTYDEPFVAGSDDVRCYLLGRRSVGLAIVKMLSLKPDLFSEKPKGDL